MNNRMLWVIMTALTVACVQRSALAGPLERTNSPRVHAYAVGKKVSDFPTTEDLSTPETAYAACNRLCASGEQDGWRKLSVKKLAARLPIGKKRIDVPASAAREWLEAEIVEVRIYKDSLAMVFAKIPHPLKSILDIRTFEKEAGQWRNAGNTVVGSLEDAREHFAGRVAHFKALRQLSSRPPVSQPEEHLRPFVEFLQREAADPQAFMLKALTDHSLVIMGEVHNRPRYWEFNSRLVRSPEFAQRAGVIYLEFPINDQPLIDGFLAASKFDPEPVINMLRDMFENGWPDQPTLEFFQTVWEVNQTLPPAKRLRIVLVDMARPWKEIDQREDWRKYDVDRNQFMAENIVRDLRAHATDPRHAFFIVGWMHALKNMTYPDGKPIRAAGWHLQQKLGSSNVFAAFPHCPVMSNRGRVKGRLALGLFETAFATLTNRPVAFPLDHGPFGEQVFDASLDFTTTDPYRAGFDAYLYLGPLEDEIMSPLIPGFYTDEYAQEMDRRYRLMSGHGLAEITNTEKADAAAYARLRARWWGQPRSGWSARSLGPLNAWQFGSDWEKKVVAAKHRDWSADKDAIRQAGVRLIEAIRKADYNNPGDWREFPSADVSYTVYTDYPAWMRWVCQHFGTNPIVSVELGEVFKGEENRPTIAYKLTLKDGDILQGNLPFDWDARGENWYGVEGLDWHRRKPQDAQDIAVQLGGKTGDKQRLKALVEDFFNHNFRDITSRETIAWGDMTTDEDGNASIRYQYRAKIWDKHTITNDQVFTFDSRDEFVSVNKVTPAAP